MAVIVPVLMVIAAASFVYAAWAWVDVWNRTRPKMFWMDETSARWGLETFVWSAMVGPEIRSRYVASIAALTICSGAVAVVMAVAGNGVGAGMFGLVSAALAFTAVRGILRHRAMLQDVSKA
jgi:hypothetical protein